MPHPKTILLAILTLLTLGIPSAAAGPHSALRALDPPFPDTPPSVVGHNGGAAHNITVQGSYTYLSIGSSWQDAAATCSPAATYVRDLITRTISVSLCRTGRFALFGPTQQAYLPR